MVMSRYLFGRVFHVILVLFGISVVVFVMLKLTPGDPAATMLGVQATPQELARVRQAMGLDRPWAVQYGIWLRNLLRGDLGVSYISRKPVAELIATRFPVTLELTLLAMLLAAAIGIPAGIVSAARRYTGLDYSITSFALFGVSMPSFWFGILLILLFSLYLRWLPSSGYAALDRGVADHLKHFLLPALSLGLFLSGSLARFTRSSMVETLAREFIRTGRAKGLSERVVIYRHALKNALIPTVTVLGLQFGFLMGGAVIIEQVFAFPGVGWLALIAISQRDYPVVMGVVLVVAAVFALSNLLVDIAYTWLDPRIRYEGRA
jgi:peptide/nickel transport system permease protein